MKTIDQAEFERELKRRRSTRNLILAALLIGLVVVMYVVTLAKLGRQEAPQELATAVANDREKE